MALKGFCASGQPVVSDLFTHCRASLKLCDIGVNLLDGMYSGDYHGKSVHEDDTLFVLDRARSLGCCTMIITAGTVEESRATIDFCRNCPQNQGLFSTVGVHPTRSNEFKDKEEEVVSSLRAMIEDGLATGTVAAIGECGLDYDRLRFCGKQNQQTGFQHQLDIAQDYNLPMFLHDRNTGGDFLRMVTEQREKMKGGGVVHSFTGTLEELNAFVDLGLYIGINGCSLKTEEGLQNAAAVPDSLLLLETDAPWCGIKRTHASFQHLSTIFPTAKKEKFQPGKMVKDRNEPCTMIQVLEAVAKVRGVDPVALAQQVYENSERLFPAITTTAATVTPPSNS